MNHCMLVLLQLLVVGKALPKSLIRVDDDGHESVSSRYD